MKASSSSNRNSTNSGPRSTKAKGVGFDDFVPDPNMSITHRAAQFLDWCAKNMPGRFIPYTWIAKHAHIMPRVPNGNNNYVHEIRKNKMDPIKRILWNEYDRRTVSAPRSQEPGVRATTDADDLTQHAYLRQTKRIASSAKTAQDTREKIDTGEMRNKDLRDLVERTDPILKQLGKADLMKRLQLPAHDED
jgi:hypothetical protein